MNSIFKILLAAVVSVAALGVSVVQAAESRPNILVILADDLGYSDLGCYGSEIRTPHLDELANNGLRFTQFYNTARCWPTRGALLTGYYAQQIRRDAIPGVTSGGKGGRPKWARLLPDMLKPLGYRSYHSGKWHVDGKPLEGGFDRSYWLQDCGRYFSPRVHYEDDVALPAVERGTRFYTTTAIADHAIKCLKDHGDKHAEKPFFQYVAFTSPHFPLHAPQEDISRYRDLYRQGWEKTRQQRWERQQSIGLVRGGISTPERDVGPPYHFPEDLKKLGPGEVNRPLPWQELTDEQREFQSAKMAVHAAMIDVMDREIGRILAQIRSMGRFDNTLVCFLSDNGASAEIMVRDDGHDQAAAPGSADTHLCLGPGWSTTSNAPFRRHKTWVHEGGIATPLVVHYPRGIAARGQLRHTPGHVIDLAPTILDVAGGKPFESWEGTLVPASPGKSLRPAFAEDGKVSHETLWWLHEDNRAIRAGNWKLVAAKNTPWELYDLTTDRAESKNLAADQPDKVRELEQLWNKQLEECRLLATADKSDSDKPKKANPKKAERKAEKEAAKEAAAPGQKPVKTLILPGESFLVAERPAFILWPTEEKRTKPQPWIMYAPTLPGLPDQHEKWMHEQFLAAGVAVAGIDVGEAFGNAQSRQWFTALHHELTEKRGFAKKPCLLGRSRGGLWTSSWAIENPELVAGLAEIYPVFDLRSYPGLTRAAPAYGLTPQDLETQLSQYNPIQRIEVLAKAGVPAFLIHGDVDKVVPLKDNSAEFVARYKSAGAEKLVTLVVAEGQGHNYWEGFFRCQELIDFAITRARGK